MPIKTVGLDYAQYFFWAIVAFMDDTVRMPVPVIYITRNERG